MLAFYFPQNSPFKVDVCIIVLLITTCAYWVSFKQLTSYLKPLLLDIIKENSSHQEMYELTGKVEDRLNTQISDTTVPAPASVAEDMNIQQHEALKR